MMIVFLSFLFLTATTTVTSFAPNVVKQRHAITELRSTTNAILSLTLDKPLGLLLEEVEEGAPKGVMVQDVAEGGSAFSYQDQLKGLVLATVQGADVTTMMFDDIMDKIIAAPSPVSIDFKLMQGTEELLELPMLEIGTPVAITVIQDGKTKVVMNTKVGDNLRKTLLANDVELYRGLKKKLGNCGGAGQCTFCAVKFVDSEGWAPRSEYEESKIGKFKDARLACMTNIQGPAIIEVQ